MSFAYTPAKIKNWSNQVINYLTGTSDSFKACFGKFDTQMGKLTQDNVWTGQAAKKNYQNFCDTHNAMVSFINSFERQFGTAMETLAKNVNDMETKNLGQNVSISSTFGKLNIVNADQMQARNFNTDKVVYDYAIISSIYGELKNIKAALDNVKSSLDKKINELDNKTEIWDGNSAANCKETLLKTLSSNYNAIIAQLNICISNIGSASENARTADN